MSHGPPTRPARATCDRQIARLGTLVGGQPADPLETGDPPADPRRLAVRAPRPSSCTALFVLQPLVLTVQYSFYRWDGVGPATWVGLVELRRRS